MQARRSLFSNNTDLYYGKTTCSSQIATWPALGTKRPGILESWGTHALGTQEPVVCAEDKPAVSAEEKPVEFAEEKPVVSAEDKPVVSADKKSAVCQDIPQALCGQ